MSELLFVVEDFWMFQAVCKAVMVIYIPLKKLLFIGL